MSDADRIAMRVKCQPLRKEASMIVLGQKEWHAVLSNQDPCDPPDYDKDARTFCGLPVRAMLVASKLAFIVDIP